MGDLYKLHVSGLPKATPRSAVMEAFGLLQEHGFPLVRDAKMFSTNAATITSALITLHEPVAAVTAETWAGQPWAFGLLHCRVAEPPKRCSLNKNTFPTYSIWCFQMLMVVGVVNS